MRRAVSSLRWCVPALFALALLALPRPTMGQCVPQSPPLQAALIWNNLPPNGVFFATTPISLILQLANVSGCDLTTIAGTSTAPYWLRLVFTGARGGTITSGEHKDLLPSWCLSQNNVALPTALPVLPAEVLPGGPPPPTGTGFFRQYTIDDARQFYPPPPGTFPPGHYFVKFASPFQTFGQTIACDQFKGQTLVNLTQANPLTVASNTLEFFVCCLTFTGFSNPIGTAVPNPCVSGASPSSVSNLGNTLPFKFQLTDASRAVVSNAVALTSAQKCTSNQLGPPFQGDLGQGSVPTNQFRFDTGGQQYVFNLDTKVLSPGQWQINASVDDGSVHSVLIQLQ